MPNGKSKSAQPRPELATRRAAEPPKAPSKWPDPSHTMTLSEVAACSCISYDTLLRAVRAADSGIQRKFNNPQSIQIGAIFSKLGGPTARVLASKILSVFGADDPAEAEPFPPSNAPSNATSDARRKRSLAARSDAAGSGTPGATSPNAADPSTLGDPAGSRDRFGKKEATRMRELSDDNLAVLLRSAIDALRESNTAANRERIEAAVAAMHRRKMDVPQIVVRGLSIERLRRDSNLFTTIGDFLSASPPGSGKTWLFVRVAGGRPVDLLTASQDELSRGQLKALTIEQYLEALAGALADERAMEVALWEEAEIEAFLADAPSAQP